MTSLIHQYQNSQGVSRDPVTGRRVKDASISSAAVVFADYSILTGTGTVMDTFVRIVGEK